MNKEYPDTIRGLFHMFPDEKACLDYLISLRWPMRHIPDASGYSLIPFIKDSISTDATVVTDGWSGYSKTEENGYIRKIINLSNSDDFTHVVMPGVHRLSSLLKRWILGTHQGSVSDMHLQAYLEEYTFRFI